MNSEIKFEAKFFWIIFFFVLINFLSISNFRFLFAPIQYLRQPFIVLVILFLFQKFPETTEKKPKFSFVLYFFGYLIFYLIFNVANSLDIVNSLTYGIWLIVICYTMFQLIVQRNHLSFKNSLYNFSFAGGIVGGLILIYSYVGGYVLGISHFFDERYNYTLGAMKTEFSGIFFSNNTLGVCAFLTFSFLLMLSVLVENKRAARIFLLGAFGISILVVDIGNRASMACCLALWGSYFLYVRANVYGILIFVMLILVGSVVFSDRISEKLRLEQFEGGNLFGNRSKLIDEAIQITDNMDFFGVGYHNQRLSRKSFQVIGENDQDLNFHNTYLAVITELGWLGLLWIPGLILYGLFVFGNRNGLPENQQPLKLLMSMLLIITSIYLFVEDSVNSPGSPTFIVFWMLFLIMLIGKKEEKPLES